jgi:phosphatidate cytidylyltransferase
MNSQSYPFYPPLHKTSSGVLTCPAMLKYRLIFGPIMIAAFLGLCWLDNRLDQVNIDGTLLQPVFAGRGSLPAGLVMLVVFIAIIPLATRELCAIFRAKNIPADYFMVTLSGISGLLLMYAIPYKLDGQTTLAIVTSVIAALFLATMIKYNWIHKRAEGAVGVAGLSMLSLVYLGLLPGFLIAIRRWHSAWVLIAIILIVKACDIGAFATGKTIGRHKLIPWLSPGKTWEGLAGGVLFSGIIAVLLAIAFNHYGLSGMYDRVDGVRTFLPYQIPLWPVFAAGMAMGAIGQFGDLTASLLKRDAGIKDSGSAIPGFGGIIDVIDSPIVVAPVAYWLLRLLDAYCLPAPLALP